ncbi:MAG: ABC transporter substrate-binding protein [Hyphomicrobiales bacterium]|nr:ABC transporter substrate-binding protein [Hyphomicrobiales bacterium]MBV8664521.1 ABC transporter substrate-binding protein [Hyphomicrobiales bacterium]
MERDRNFLEHLLSLALRSPHAADFGRREFLRATGQLGLSAVALAELGKLLGPALALAADAGHLPEITRVPDRLKGKGEVRVCSWGGALQEAQRKAYFQPFEQSTGIKVIEAEGPDSAKIKAMVDTNNIEWDVAELNRDTVMNLVKKGDYFEKIDYGLCDSANIDAAFRYEYALDMLPYATIYAYRTDAFKGAEPEGWADFWDVARFPGPRTMPGGAGGILPILEGAMIAAGTPMDKVYPIDIDKAYASLAKIKPSVVKWWDAGAIPAQLLNDKEVNMGVAWNGRIAAIQAKGAPVKISWRGGTINSDCWAIPKGAPNRENAQKFTAFTTLAEPQARLSILIPYGFVNNAAAELIPPERLKTLPTSPEIKKNLIIYNYEWWAANLDKVVDRWASFVLQ